jgi:hypothetical protein
MVEYSYRNEQELRNGLTESIVVSRQKEIELDITVIKNGILRAKKEFAEKTTELLGADIENRLEAFAGKYRAYLELRREYKEEAAGAHRMKIHLRELEKEYIKKKTEIDSVMNWDEIQEALKSIHEIKKVFKTMG